MHSEPTAADSLRQCCPQQTLEAMLSSEAWFFRKRWTTLQSYKLSKVSIYAFFHWAVLAFLKIRCNHEAMAWVYMHNRVRFMAQVTTTGCLPTWGTVGGTDSGCLCRIPSFSGLHPPNASRTQAHPCDNQKCPHTFRLFPRSTSDPSPIPAPTHYKQGKTGSERKSDSFKGQPRWNWDPANSQVKFQDN